MQLVQLVEHHEAPDKPLTNVQHRVGARHRIERGLQLGQDADREHLGRGLGCLARAPGQATVLQMLAPDQRASLRRAAMLSANSRLGLAMLPYG